jgi:hypothetical protein
MRSQPGSGADIQEFIDGAGEILEDIKIAILSFFFGRLRDGRPALGDSITFKSP